MVQLCYRSCAATTATAPQTGLQQLNNVAAPAQRQWGQLRATTVAKQPRNKLGNHRNVTLQQSRQQRCNNWAATVIHLYNSLMLNDKRESFGELSCRRRPDEPVQRRYNECSPKEQQCSTTVRQQLFNDGSTTVRQRCSDCSSTVQQLRNSYATTVSN